MQAELTPDAIRSWRKEKDLSQRQLAKLLGTGEATIARWELGDSKPSGTAGTILLTLINGKEIKNNSTKEDVIALVAMGGALATGYAIWKLLNEVFSEPPAQARHDGDHSIEGTKNKTKGD